MALFRFSDPLAEAPALSSGNLRLRAPRLSDYEQWARLRDESRSFLAAWEPIWPADELSRESYKRRIKRYAEEMRRDEAYPFFLIRENDQVLLGGLTLGFLRRGVAQAATLGYWIGASHAQQGYMGAAVRLALSFAFGHLGLQRVEAACLPHNEASIRLLDRVGFHREGLARRYLCINGRWQDHLLFAILSTDPIPPPLPRSSHNNLDNSPVSVSRAAQ
jgi:ribosomal-protein-alanine N-acetyltransferase